MKDINKIKMIISDVDGVWTDGSIYKGHSSTADIELKKFSVSDGAAVALIREAGLKLALISGRKSSATQSRASELKIKDVYNGTLNKIPPYEEFKTKYTLSDEEIASVADDLIDHKGSLLTAGKKTGKDRKKGKATLISLLGYKNTIKYDNKLIFKINTKLKKYGSKSRNLSKTLEYILNRNK